MRRAAIAPLVTILAAGTAAGAARADRPAASRAESLFDEGLAAFDAGRLDEACAKFEESLALDFANGTLMNLARCHEQQGRLAKAWSEYRDAAVLSRRADQPLRAEVAEVAAARLALRLPRLRVLAPAAPAGLALSSNGEPLALSIGGEPVVVEPGLHRISVRAPGYAPYEATVTVREGSQVSELVIPPLRPTAWDQSPLLWCGIGTGALGLTAIAAGSVLVALDAPTRDAEPRRDASIALLAAGGALTAAATVMFVVERTEPTVRVTAAATPAGGRAGVRFDW